MKWKIFKPKQAMFPAKCGHMTKKEGVLYAFKEKRHMKMSFPDDKIEYCLDCLSAMTTRCAWCGRPIFIGDQITLYAAKPGSPIPEYAIKEETNGTICLVGCGRSDCADTGADYCGTWLPPGIIKKHQSLIEIAMANPDCAVTKDEDGIKVIEHRKMEEL